MAKSKSQESIRRLAISKAQKRFRRSSKKPGEEPVVFDAIEAEGVFNDVFGTRRKSSFLSEGLPFLKRRK